MVSAVVAMRMNKGSYKFFCYDRGELAVGCR